MKARGLAGSIFAAALALGCGGGGGQKSATDGGGPGGGGAAPDGGGGSGGSLDGGATDGGATDGGATDGGAGGDEAPQVLPPYVGRIVVTPAALLFTDAGQSATLHAQAFDAQGAPLNAAFTFTSSRPAEVAVDSTGNVTSVAAVGSTQITVTGAGLTSRPLLVLVVKPQPGTVLVSDAQVVDGPTPVDATADPLPGAQYKVTLDGVGALAAGTTIVSREGNAIAGQVVSTAPNGAHTDVVYQMGDLLSLFASLHVAAGYEYNEQTAADDDAIAAMAAAASAPAGVTTTKSALASPSPCKFDFEPTGVTVTVSASVHPDLRLDFAFSEDDNDTWTEAKMILSGDISATGKATVTLMPGAGVSASCKYQWKEFIPPVAGPLSAFVAPRFPVGIKAKLQAAAVLNSLEYGAQLNHQAHFQLGFDYGVGGVGDVANLDLGQDEETKPVYKVNPDPFPPNVEISAAVGAYASFNFTAANFALAEAFVGAKMKYTMTTLAGQVGKMNPNLYQLKAPVEEVGQGSDVKKFTELLKGAITFKTTFSKEGPVIGQSPQGTFTADNKMLNIPVGQSVTFTATLDPTTTSFLGAVNVSGLHIYRIDATIPSAMTAPEEMKYINGPGPTYTWTWTPKADEPKKIYVFFAALDDELIYDLYPLTPVPFVVGKAGTMLTTQLDVVPPLNGWGGTLTLAWMGTGHPSPTATSTESGMETITLVPGMPSLDGMSFDLLPTSTTFSASYGFTESGEVGVCPTHRTYTATGGFTHTGADADTDAHGLLLLIPNGDGNATYMIGVPGFSDTVDYTDDTTSDCGISSSDMGSVLIGATGTGVCTGTIPLTAQSFKGGTSYTAQDGVGGETMMYQATWDMQRM